MDIDSYKETPLGKKTDYIDTYTPSLLCKIPRWDSREDLDFDDLELDGDALPFRGVDYWNAYEISWLEPSGKPVVAAAEFVISCASRNLIESKSLKLYLNSFNQTKFNSKINVIQTLENDLTIATGVPVMVKITEVDKVPDVGNLAWPGDSIDGEEVECTEYSPNPDYLDRIKGPIESESLYSHMLRTCCPVTGQPDWGSVLIRHRGRPIDRPGLLKYIISFRRHDGFHEQIIEQIFVDILKRCKPEQLSVYGRFTRRGGLDINPFRSTYEEPLPNTRQYRQ